MTTPSANHSPLWPAQLDHIVRESDRPEALLAFYRDGFGMVARPLASGAWAVEAPRRRLIVAPAAPVIMFVAPGPIELVHANV